MPIAELYSGTEAAIGTTEWSCTTDTAGPDVDTNDGVFQAFFDVSDMVLGDVLQIRIYEKARSTDTQYIAYETILRDVQTEKIFVTPALILLHGWDFTVKALAGTIAVNWSIRQVS
jgi:hypothetical protein